MYFCRSWFCNMVSLRCVLVFGDFLHDIFSIKFYMISSLCKRNFLIGKKHTQWMSDIKVKVFHESISCFTKWPWNCILPFKSRNKNQQFNTTLCLILLFFCIQPVNRTLSFMSAAWTVSDHWLNMAHQGNVLLAFHCQRFHHHRCCLSFRPKHDS